VGFVDMDFVDIHETPTQLSTIATLRHVVRETGYDHAGQTRHDRKLNTNQN
jgi:hypothetical protein